MIPSAKWFPSSLQNRAAWFENFATQFEAVGASLGFTAGEISSNLKDNEVIQFLAEAAAQLKAYEKAVQQFRIIITEGDVGDATPQFPANPDFTLPASVETGIFERLAKLVDRIRTSPNYTDEIGALLGILPTQSESISPEQIKPVATVSDGFGGYKFNVHATRMGMDSYKVQVRKSGSEIWTDAAFSTVSDVEVTITPTNPGQPERIQVRVILLKKNEPIGQPSDAVYTTVNP